MYRLRSASRVHPEAHRYGSIHIVHPYRSERQSGTLLVISDPAVWHGDLKGWNSDPLFPTPRKLPLQLWEWVTREKSFAWEIFIGNLVKAKGWFLNLSQESPGNCVKSDTFSDGNNNSQSQEKDTKKQTSWMMALFFSSSLDNNLCQGIAHKTIEVCLPSA